MKITDPKKRIVIVGAGPAGLATARYLNKQGFRDVTILEKLGRVGGLCRTITEDGKSYDLGANYVTLAYRETLELAREVGATRYTEAPYSAVTIPADDSPVTYMPLVRAVREYGPPEDRRTHSLWRVLRAALKYAWLRFRLRRVIDRPNFAEIDEHPELCVSFAEWLERHDIECLTTMFEIPITMMGYNYLRFIAAPYALKYMSLATYIPMVLKGLPGIQRIVPWPCRFTLGFQRLWERMSWKLNVRLNVDIKRIERDETGVTVTFTQLQQIFNETKTHRAEIKFDYLILACPLSPDVLTGFMDVEGEELELLGRIRANSYCMTTYHVHALDLPTPFLVVLPLTSKGTPWGIAQQFAGASNVTQFYSRVMKEPPDNEGVQKEITGNVQTLVERLGGHLDEENVGWFTYDRWPYFQHVTHHDMKEGWYRSLEALQGRNRTFYVGGATSFELIEPIMEYSKHLTATHFGTTA